MDVPDRPRTDDEIRAYTVGELKRLDGPILLVAYDPKWPELFAREAAGVEAALGQRALRIEHVGSTAVPGLVAKPVIDMVLVVADSADEQAYVPPLESAGYVLHIREADWYEHRMFKDPVTAINLHVFTSGCPETARMLVFRDWLRQNAADRDLYASTKQALAGRSWKYVQSYADAKRTIIEAIMSRAKASPPRDPFTGSRLRRPCAWRRNSAPRLFAGGGSPGLRGYWY